MTWCHLKCDYACCYLRPNKCWCSIATSRTVDVFSICSVLTNKNISIVNWFQLKWDLPKYVMFSVLIQSLCYHQKLFLVTWEHVALPGVPLRQLMSIPLLILVLISAQCTILQNHHIIYFIFLSFFFFFFCWEFNSCCSNVLENFFYCILRKATQQGHECHFSVKRMLGFPSIVSCWEHYYQCCCF